MTLKTLTFTLAFFATAVHGQNYYEARKLDVLPGYLVSEPLAINNHGQIVGYSYNYAGNRRAFLYNSDDCTLRDLGSLGGNRYRYSFATGINDAGLIVGLSQNHMGKNRAFSFSQGVMQDLGGDGEQHALAVNNSGYIVGFESSVAEARVYRSGQAEGFPPYLVSPASGARPVSRATGVNDSGRVVGYLELNPSSVGPSTLGLIFEPKTNQWFQIPPVAADPKVPDLNLATKPSAVNQNGFVTGWAGLYPIHAFLSSPFSTAPALDLGTLYPEDPGSLSVGAGINQHNHVVGWSQMPGQVPAAFLHDGSTMIDLNTRLVDPASWELVSAQAINDRGQIVGMGYYNGQYVGFVLLPVQSPSLPNFPSSPKSCRAGTKLL